MPAMMFIILLFLHVPLAFFSASAQPEGSVLQRSRKEIFRRRRQACADGTYLHGDRTCCLCAAGQRLKSHCSKNPEDRQCELCEPGTYNSGPNSLETCQRCTSCSQENANLEVDLPCTPARDTKCRCKEGHFCDSDTGICKICHPCTKCDYGTIQDCTLTSDAICHEKSKANTIIAVSIFAVVLVVAGAVGVYFFVWKKRKQQPNPAPKYGEGPAVEMRPREVEELEPLLPDIVDVLGWKDMKDVATRGGIKDTVIESCERNHPGDNQEQTLQLLKVYVQAQGKNAPKELIRILKKSSKKGKAEKVSDILYGNNRDGQNPSA